VVFQVVIASTYVPPLPSPFLGRPPFFFWIRPIWIFFFPLGQVVPSVLISPNTVSLLRSKIAIRRYLFSPIDLAKPLPVSFLTFPLPPIPLPILFLRRGTVLCFFFQFFPHGRGVSQRFPLSSRDRLPLSHIPHLFTGGREA